MPVEILMVAIIILVCIFSYYTTVQKTKLEQLQQELARKQEKDTRTKAENEKIKKENDRLKAEQIKIETTIKNQNAQYQTLQEIQEQATEKLKENSQKAFSNYCDILDADYEKKNNEYDKKLANKIKDYEQSIAKINEKLSEEQAELDKIHATRAAAVQAVLREKEIKERQSFYCIQISENDKVDINTLERIKLQLNKPRILSMLIWSTFFQKKMTELCNNIVGTTEKTGIYKITNQVTNECYIGQAIKITDRWKQHAKCGLGIDTPAGNKLYQAMEEYKLWNFSWEVLEECPSSLLNEKEKYYIELYDSSNYGYNSNKGISKK